MFPFDDVIMRSSSRLDIIFSRMQYLQYVSICFRLFQSRRPLNVDYDHSIFIKIWWHKTQFADSQVSELYIQISYVDISEG